MDEVVIDSSIIITFLIPPANEREANKLIHVTQLFQQIENGTITAVLPEVVLHETFYTLLGKRFPDVKLSPLCRAISTIIRWPGWQWKPQEQSINLRAIDILEAHPKLEFSDAVIAARAETYGAELATFDQGLLAVYDGPVWSID